MRARVILLLVLMCAGVAAQRLRTYAEPFEHDLMIYAVIGHELLHGGSLYTDVVDHKPPAVYATFAAAEALVGYGPQQIYLIGVAASCLTLVAVFLCGATTRAATGLFAGLLWVLASYGINLQANQPNTEAMINALLTLAFALLLRVDGSQRAALVIAGAGVLVGLASLFKPMVIVIAPLWLLIFMLREGGDWRGTLRRAGKLSLLLVVPLLMWAAVVGYFALTGRFKLFVTVVYSFNAWYAGNMWANATRMLTPAGLWPGYMGWPYGALLVVSLGLLLAPGRTIRRQLPLLGFAAAVVVMVAVQGRGWNHYYQLYLPPLVLAAAWSIEGLRLGQSHARRWLGTAVGSVLVAILAIAHLSDLRLGPNDASLRKYGSTFVTVREAARVASQLMQGDERLFVWGIDPGFYFYTGRRPVSSFLWATHLRGPLTELLTERLRHDLRTGRPELIVIDKRFSMERLPPGLQAWLLDAYAPLPVRQDLSPYRLVGLKGSALMERALGGERPSDRR
jgi:4-amino-4-deoxy-L-arabinose transferase-like glycosyltransferase